MALSWSYFPSKRLLCPKDDFFEEGNIHCNVLRKQINCSDVEDFVEWSAPEFKCSITGCKEYFVNIKRYETHYRSCHWNTCKFCKKSFQTSLLLDLHILENHDTLFQMIAKKNYMYRCLVESCPDKFGSEDDRKSHLVEFHQYPTDFRFNKSSRKQRKIKSKDTLESKNKVIKEAPMELDTAINVIQSCSVSQHDKQSQHRAPKSICFGRGCSRGFHRQIPSRGKKKKANIQDVNMS